MSTSPTSNQCVPRIKDEEESSVSSRTIVIGVSRKRARPRFSCDVCHRKKIKCDGGSPCGYCSKHKQECFHSEATAPKRRKIDPSTRARPSIEEALYTSHARQYYYYLFVEKLNPMCRVFNARMFIIPIENRRSRSELFEEGIALAHTARALGHLEIAEKYYQQARHTAGELIDDFCSSTAVAYALLMLYAAGHSNDLAIHYGTIAQSIATHSVQDTRTWNVSALMLSTRILEGPNRRSFRTPADCSNKSAELTRNLGLAPWYSHENGEALEIVRSFPKHAELLDIFCNHKILSRYPEDERSDDYPPLADIEAALNRYQDQKALAEKVTANDAWKACQYLLHTGILVFLSGAARVVELARFYCRRILTCLREIPSAQTGFNYKQIFIPIALAGQFVSMYRVHPFDETLDHRLYLRELCDFLLPLAPMFSSCDSVCRCLTKLISDAGPPSRHYTALPVHEQIAIAQRWMQDYPRVHNIDTFLAEMPLVFAPVADKVMSEAMVPVLGAPSPVGEAAPITEADAMLLDWLLGDGRRDGAGSALHALQPETTLVISDSTSLDGGRIEMRTPDWDTILADVV